MLEIKTSKNQLVTREYKVPSSYVNPNHANALEAGLWLQPDATQTSTEYLTTIGTADVNLAFPIWSKKGEYSTQALTQVTAIVGGTLIALTDQYNSTENYTIQQQLTVENGVLTPRAGGYAAYTVHAIVLLPPDANNGKLLFRAQII